VYKLKQQFGDKVEIISGGQPKGADGYAKKYALGNLFLLDDTKDADSNKVNEPVKPTMTTDIYNSMLEAINTGKASAVKSKLGNYTTTPKQVTTLNGMIIASLIKE
jgi:hypothetical protein